MDESNNSFIEECPICFNLLSEEAADCHRLYGNAVSMSQVACTPCGHAYHLVCISRTIVGGSTSCPICRVHVDLDSLNPCNLDHMNCPVCQKSLKSAPNNPGNLATEEITGTIRLPKANLVNTSCGHLCHQLCMQQHFKNSSWFRWFPSLWRSYKCPTCHNTMNMNRMRSLFTFEVEESGYNREQWKRTASEAVLEENTNQKKVKADDVLILLEPVQACQDPPQQQLRRGTRNRRPPNRYMP